MCLKNKNRSALAFLLLAFILGSFFLFPKPAFATAGINQEISFEGKIVNTNDTNIPDGNYNMEFKVYSGNSNTGSGDTLLFTEDWLVNNTQGVAFTSGTFQANIGSLGTETSGGDSVALSSLNWNQYPLWMSIQIGNTSSCTQSGNFIPGTTSFSTYCGGNGEMTPYIEMTSAPYALDSNELGGLTSASFAQLAASQTFTAANTFQPTTNVTGVKVLQNSNASPTADVFDVQGANGSSNFIQVTSTAANQGAVTIASLGSGNNLNLNSGSNTISVGATNITGTGALTIAAASGQSTDLESGSTATLNVGVSANNKTINIGATGSTANTTTVNIATSTGAAQTVTIGNNNTSGNTVTIDGGTAATGIQIGNSTTAHGIEIGDGGTSTQSIIIGSTSSASATTLQAGSGNINLDAGTIVGTNTTQNLFNTVATTLNIGGAIGSSGGTLKLAGGSTGGGCTITGTAGNLACEGGLTVNNVEATGYQTSNTSNTSNGDYTLLGTCTLTAQYQDCRSDALIVSTSDGNATGYRAVVDFRTKQQAAMGSAPIVNVEVYDTNTLVAADFVAVTTVNNSSTTTVGLYGLINSTYQAWQVSPEINTGNVPATWLSFQGFSATLPSGTQTAAVYSNSTLNSLSVVGSSGLTVTGTTSLNASSNYATNINTGTSTGAVTIGNNGTAGNTVTIDGGTAATGIQIGNSTTAHGIEIGAGGTATQTVLIGSTSSASSTTINAGSGNINLDSGTVVGTATTQNLFNSVATTLNFGGAATSLNVGPTTSVTGTLNLASGSSVDGCTINDSNGNLTCAGSITPGVGPGGYLTRSGTTLQPYYSGDNITTSGNLSTTGSGTITSAGLLTGSSGLTVTGAVASLNASSNYATNINTGTSTGAVTIGNNGTAGNTVTIDGGTGSSAIQIGNTSTAHGIQIGTGAAVQTIVEGSTSSTSSTLIQAGTGNLSLTTQGTGTLGIGNNAVAQNIAVGNSTGSTIVTIAGGNGSGSSSGIQLQSQGNILIGNNALAQTVTIGNTTGATGLSELVGTGNYSLNGAATSTYIVGSSTTTGTYTLGGASQTGAITLGQFSGTSGTSNIYLGNAVGAGGTQNIAIGSSTTGISTLTLGSTSSTSTLSLQGGSNSSAISVQAATSGTISIGTTNGNTIDIGNPYGTASTINIGNTNGSGSGATLNINTGGVGTTTIGGGSVNIDSNAGNVDIGTNSGGNVNIDSINDLTIESLNKVDIEASTNNLLLNTDGASTGSGLSGLGNVVVALQTGSSLALCVGNNSRSNDQVRTLDYCESGGVSDYAEEYPMAANVTVGDIVATGTEMVNTYGIDPNNGDNVDWNDPIGQITQEVETTVPYQTNTVGVVSNNSSDFSSTGYNIEPSDNPMSLALNGRVPVNISPSSQAIEPGDYITTSGDSGEGMLATHAGEVIGMALGSWTPGSGQAQVMVFVKTQYWPGPDQASYLQNGQSASFSNLNVSGNTTLNDLTVKGDEDVQGSLAVDGSITADAASITGALSAGGLNISGDATLFGLTVNGDSTFNGNITVNGHIITGGSTPTSQVLTAAGTNAAVSISGNDTSGTITINTGDPSQPASGSNPAIPGPSAGDQASLTFSNPYSATPRVILTPDDSKSASLEVYPDSQSASGFSIGIIGTPAPNTTYNFNYLITQ